MAKIIHESFLETHTVNNSESPTLIEFLFYDDEDRWFATNLLRVLWQNNLTMNQFLKACEVINAEYTHAALARIGFE